MLVGERGEESREKPRESQLSRGWKVYASGAD
jgi:hypothetical protein